MGVACNKHGDRKVDTAFRSERLKERDYLEDVDIVGRKTYFQLHLKERG
jgi:hypothetical protein